MKKRNASGFTLIELLAAISVMLILVVITSQLVGAVSSVFRAGKARIDTFNQARDTFGALDRDIRQMVLRPDLAAFPSDPNPPDPSKPKSLLAFYTRVQGGVGDRAVSLVQYTLSDPINDPSAAKPPMLFRRNYGIGYNGSNPERTLSFGNTTALTDLSNANVESRELAKGIIRINWQFIDATGAAGDSFVFNYDDPNDTKNTRVVQISLFVLDEVSYNLVLKSGNLSTVVTDTDKPSNPKESRGQYWERLIDSGNWSNILPRPVLRAMQVFEHSVIIPTNR